MTLKSKTNTILILPIYVQPNDDKNYPKDDEYIH